MYENIKEKYPILENRDDFIRTILDIRVSFNALECPFKIIIGDNYIGDVDKYLTKLKQDRRVKKKKRNKKALRRGLS